MDRRSLLGAGACGFAAGVAGCLISMIGEETPDGVVLDPPEDQRGDSEDLVYPAYGQSFPEFSLPDPIADETISIGEVDDRCLVSTAFFATCPAECLSLIRNHRVVHDRTMEEGLDSFVSFLPITFDPERDDAGALAAYADRMRIDLSAGNWHFLRPESPAAAEAVVTDELGIAFEREGDGEFYDFTHITVTFLVNPEGYVERTYQTASPDPDRLFEDVRAIREAIE